MIILPISSLPYLKAQHTELPEDSLEASYNKWIQQYIKNISPYLPKKINSITDVGAGIGGVAAALHKKYNCFVNIIEKDIWEKDKPIIAYHNHHKQFGGYNSFATTKELWEINKADMNKLKLINTDDILTDKVNFPKSDVVISTLSWGFHYPVDTYFEKAKTTNALIILDCRKGVDVPLNGECIFEGLKFKRMLWS